MTLKKITLGLCALVALALGVAFTFGLIGPSRARAAERVGLEFADQGRWHEAKQQLDRALSLNPQSPDALIARARVLRRLGEDEAALADLEVFRLAYPKDARGWTEAVALHFDRERYAEAIALADRGLRFLPVLNIDLAILSAKAQAGDGKYTEATQSLDNILAMHSRCHRAHHLKGRLHRRRGDPELALRAFGEALALAPRNATYRRDYAELLAQ